MNILDNDSDFSFDEELDAEYVTDKSMSALWDICVQPMKPKLSPEDLALIGVIGMTLKIVAQKAKCYEQLQKSELASPKKDTFYRN
jgi:hypothetical protein